MAKLDDEILFSLLDFQGGGTEQRFEIRWRGVCEVRVICLGRRKGLFG